MGANISGPQGILDPNTGTICIAVDQFYSPAGVAVDSSGVSCVSQVELRRLTNLKHLANLSPTDLLSVVRGGNKPNSTGSVPSSKARLRSVYTGSWTRVLRLLQLI